MTRPPDSLIRFGDELVRAIDREQRAPQRRRRLALNVAVAAALSAIVVLGAVSLLGDRTPLVGRSAVDTASAAERAAIVLDPSPGHVVHEVVGYRQTLPGGRASSWREETWRATSAPYARRSLTTSSDGARLETSTQGSGAAALYDPATNTIYTNPPSSGPALGTPVQARDGDPIRDQLVQLLQSGAGQRITRSTFDGRKVIRFVYENASPGGEAVRWGYVADAHSYAPIQITTTSPDGSRTTARFRRYETLAADAETARLLSVHKEHPAAAVDSTEAGYVAALARVHAHGP